MAGPCATSEVHNTLTYVFVTHTTCTFCSNQLDSVQVHCRAPVVVTNVRPMYHVRGTQHPHMYVCKLAKRTEKSQRDLLALRDPKFGPAGVVRRSLLQRNGNSVPPAQWIKTRRVKIDFRRKAGRSQAISESIRKIPRGKTMEISMPLVFSVNGPKRAVSAVFRALVGGQNGASTFGMPRLPFSHMIVGFEERKRDRFGPVYVVPGPKRVLENGRKQSKATGWNSITGPFMNESEKGKITFWCRLFGFSR